MRSPACFTRCGQQGRAFHRRVALAAGQHAPDLAADQRLQRLGRIARHVEGAVAGDGERAGGCDQFGHAGFVDRAVGGQAADHHAGDAKAAQGFDIGEHGAEFGIAVEEIAAARPHDDVERHGRHGQRHAHRAKARRDAALDQAGAEFDAVGAGVCAASRPSMPSTQTSIRGRARWSVFGEGGRAVSDIANDGCSVAPAARRGKPPHEGARRSASS